MEYPIKKVLYEDLERENFQPEQPTLYEIMWDGVKFEFLVNYRPETDTAVVIGTGALDKPRNEWPFFSRHTWKDQIKSTGIWYFDPTVYLAPINLAWGYGTEERWYLKDIATLIQHILKKLLIPIDNVLFYGSSGGGYMSLVLATLLRGKASVINPQILITNYKPTAVQNVRREIWKADFPREIERVDLIALIEKEGYVPFIHLVINSSSSIDICDQVIPFLNRLVTAKIDFGQQLRIDFYSEEGGHGAMPPKEDCLKTIHEDLRMPLSRYVQNVTQNPCPAAALLGEVQKPTTEKVDPGNTLAICAKSQILGVGITTEVTGTVDKEIQYAYYLYEKSKGILLQQGYIADRVFTFLLSEYGDGDYYVRAFVRRKDGNGGYVKKSTLTNVCPFRMRVYKGIRQDDIAQRMKTIPAPTSGFPDNTIVEAAQNIMSGQMRTFSRLAAHPYNVTQVDWQMKPDAMANTFQLYLQCLNPVVLLLQAYGLTGSAEYLEFGRVLVRSWQAFAANEKEAQNNKYLWNDHAMAARTSCLIYFGYLMCQGALEDDGFLEELLDLISMHGEKLADDSFYTKRHNHGIMQDQSLLYVGFLFQNRTWIDCAKRRLKEQKDWAFNSEMVHTENSPGYAKLVINLFRKVAQILTAFEDPMGAELFEDMEKAEVYSKWTTMPNGFVAQIGDTQGVPGKLYATNNNVPRPVTDLHRAYPNSGIYFYRSAYDQHTKNDTWKIVKSGYDQTTHKHADDGSFMLYSKGYEVFIDGGLYGYTSDSFRDYFKSSKAHNTVVVDNHSYPCDMEHKELIGMSGYHFFSDYDYVRVYNNAYEGVSWERDFCSADDLTILMDSIASTEKHTYSQVFHLAEHIELLDADDREVVLKLADSGFVVRLRQFGDPVHLTIIKGNRSVPGYGLISRGTNHLDVIVTLKFDLIAKAGIFATAISIEDSSGCVRLGDRKEAVNTLGYDTAKKTFKIGNLIIPCR